MIGRRVWCVGSESEVRVDDRGLACEGRVGGG